MKNLTKKIMIFSMVGMMQVGFGAAVLEASPLHTENSHRFVQFDDRHDDDHWRQHEHDERLRRENERHRHEMERREHESRREWRERQERERQHHEDNLREIGAFLIGIAIGASN
ncbi:MAG: hypothetical protein H6Q70_3365 [Firmicutes bacterium]|nr:hypothetical protein [Bacillota bacterium]